jgi:hypothetical protein
MVMAMFFIARQIKIPHVIPNDEFTDRIALILRCYSCEE